MMNVTLVAVGKLKEEFYINACAEYIKRLGAFCRLEVVEVTEQRLSKSPSAGEIQSAFKCEATAITAALPRGTTTIVLAVEGNKLSSPDFADTLRRFANSGASRIALIIGGSNGLDEELKAQAALRLSMSDMTFPHHLARVMVLEQLYRAFMINAGTQYHK